MQFSASKILEKSVKTYTYSLYNYIERHRKEMKSSPLTGINRIVTEVHTDSDVIWW